MFLALLLILTITLGGLTLTFYLTEGKGFLWRVAAGNIVGSVVFGVVCCLIAFSGVGLNWISIGISWLVLAALAFKLRSLSDTKEYKHEYDKVRGKMQRYTHKRMIGFAFYFFYFLLFMFFFERAMIVTDEGIFTGATNNLGDLPYHLGAIFSFSEAANLTPQNPSYAGAKFTYPYLADFLAAVFVKLGATAKWAMFLQNVTWAMALVVILEKFVASFTGNKFAGRIGTFLLFFSGGLGFLWFFKDYWQGAIGFLDILWNLPRDYTIGEKFRWGNSMIVLFITQRSLLLGMPLALIVLHYVWDVFSGDESDSEKENDWKQPVAYGVLVGLLPLVHVHSILALFVITGFLAVASLGKLKTWITFGAPAAVVGLGLIFFLMSGSETRSAEFLAWHIGFHSQGENLIWFWFKNTGIFLPIAVAGGLLIWKTRKEEETNETLKKLYFAVPFLFIFVICNLFKFAPWEWDNIKLLIYWWVGLIPFVTLLLTWVWTKGTYFKGIAVAILGGLILSGALDVFRTASSQVEYGVFSQDAVEIAEAINDRTAKDVIILNAPTYNSAAVLSGRISLMRYLGHLSSHGINYESRYKDLKKIYAGESTADLLLEKYGVEFVLVTPLERKELNVNDEYFSRKELFAESGEYKVYRIKK